MKRYKSRRYLPSRLRPFYWGGLLEQEPTIPSFLNSKDARKLNTRQEVMA